MHIISAYTLDPCFNMELTKVSSPGFRYVATKLPRKPHKHWGNRVNIDNFLSKIKLKYNLNTSEDWNSITHKHIQSNGGATLLTKYSMYEIKCMACPEGKSIFNPKGYWENKENILKFLADIKQKYNIKTPDDWNLVTQKQILSNGGAVILRKYSLYELKCMACPEGAPIFNNPPQKSGYWGNKDNIDKFFSELKQKYNLNTPEDWNSITHNHIKSNGGRTLLKKYSMHELKCMACPEEKTIFKKPKQHFEAGYWENKENIDNFFVELKQKYNLNTPEDWNLITRKHILSNGGGTLLTKYSIFELKCIACPEGAPIFNNPPQKSEYWENKDNIDKFFLELKQKYNLNTPQDWKRISKRQIISEGGWWLLYGKNNHSNIEIQFESLNKTKSIDFKKLISKSIHKRASQNYLFLQIQKLFPYEEIIEDYYHSEISRLSGTNVQFDIFLIQQKIAFEYHGKHHYEDIPSGFSRLETYQYRDLEKETLCKQYGIQLIIIPYWWDNSIESLQVTILSKLNKK